MLDTAPPVATIEEMLFALKLFLKVRAVVNDPASENL
jgi:hypothetical protein